MTIICHFHPSLYVLGFWLFRDLVGHSQGHRMPQWGHFPGNPGWRIIVDGYVVLLQVGFPFLTAAWEERHTTKTNGSGRAANAPSLRIFTTLSHTRDGPGCTSISQVAMCPCLHVNHLKRATGTTPSVWAVTRTTPRTPVSTRFVLFVPLGGGSVSVLDGIAPTIFGFWFHPGGVLEKGRDELF